jgi:DNA-binding IclR family transcriptional regulator
MTTRPITLWQSRVLLLLTLEPQAVEEITNRMADRGAVLNTSRVRQLLEELTTLRLVTQTPRQGNAGARYGLGAGPAVDAALDQAYELINGRPASSPRQG